MYRLYRQTQDIPLQHPRLPESCKETELHKVKNEEAALLTAGAIQNVDVWVDVGVIGASHLDKGGRGEDQDVGAGGVLWGVQLGRLHVQGGAAAKHRACRHRV